MKLGKEFGLEIGGDRFLMTVFLESAGNLMLWILSRGARKSTGFVASL